MHNRLFIPVREASAKTYAVALLALKFATTEVEAKKPHHDNSYTDFDVVVGVTIAVFGLIAGVIICNLTRRAAQAENQENNAPIAATEIEVPFNRIA